MTEYLLDTHALLWLASDDERLTDRVRRLVLDTETPLWVSVASVWEMAIKKSLGKLRLADPLAVFLEDQRAALGFSLLPVRIGDALRVEALPWHHRDPFDRLLIAQAMNQELDLLSGDRDLAAYGVRVVWD